MTDEHMAPAAEDRLHRVQSVTEAALAHLTLDALLEELLLRVREFLNADTAAVLLLDERRQELIATAAKGIEAEVEQGVRLPIGHGFAGRIAATGKPVILPVVEHGKVLNPLLLERGIKSMLGVPLVVDGQVIGVLHVGTLTPRDFTETDVDLLQVVADRVALAVRARREEGQRVIAETLQRSLLPDRIPAAHNVEISVRYVPAHGGMIGGDWYDVFPLPSGELGIAIGDMVGRGLDAAVEMGRLRTALRALALVRSEPSEVLTLVNEHLIHFESGVIGSVLFGRLQSNGRFDYANAGHMPPLVIDDERNPRYVTEPGEPVVGAATNIRYAPRHIELRYGWTMLLYTDGLVERRGHSLDEGLETLRVSAGQESWMTLDDLCGMVIGDDELLDDDLAALWVQFGPPRRRERLDVRLRADPRELATFRSALRTWFGALEISEQDAYDVMVAASEAAANSIEHAYGPGGGLIFIEGKAESGVLEIVIRDQGRWREPRGTNRGRGRMLMDELMDETAISTNETGTTVTLRKTLGAVRENAS